MTAKPVWVVATLDTKSDEAEYVCTLLEAAGLSGNVGRCLHLRQLPLCAQAHISFPVKISRPTIRRAGAPYLPAIGAPPLPR